MADPSSPWNDAECSVKSGIGVDRITPPPPSLSVGQNGEAILSDEGGTHRLDNPLNRWQFKGGFNIKSA